MFLNQKRFLVAAPLAWHSQFKLLRSDSSDVMKTILDQKNGISLAKRTIFYNEEGVHAETFLYSVSKNTEEKDLKCISAYEYYDMIKDHKQPGTLFIQMKHYLFQYNKKPFHVDVYDGALDGLVILSQLYIGEHKLPPFFDIIEEVTNNQYYSNNALAYNEKFANDNNNKADIQRTQVS